MILIENEKQNKKLSELSSEDILKILEEGHTLEFLMKNFNVDEKELKRIAML